jgi:hypothetical protein
MRRKGELSSAAIDHRWPHQIVLPARLCERDGYNAIHEFCRDLTLCSRGHALYHDTACGHKGAIQHPGWAGLILDSCRFRHAARTR